jgi:hypothetical protein
MFLYGTSRMTHRLFLSINWARSEQRYPRHTAIRTRCPGEALVNRKPDKAQTFEAHTNLLLRMAFRRA